MAILAISREFGSGGSEIGRLVCENLGYHYVDKEQFIQDLDEVGERWGRVARELDEVCPTMWERYDWEYRAYLALIEACILQYARNDKVVIIGRGSPQLLQDIPFCLRIHLVATLKIRLDRIMAQEHLSREKAQRLIAQRDRDMACYIKVNYDTEWDKNELFDMILNTNKLNDDQVVNILLTALAEKDHFLTPAAKAKLDDAALAYRLKARVATDLRVFIPTLMVKLEKGVIVVSGIIHNPKERKILQEIAKEICGNKEIRFDLRHRVLGKKS
ncbi:MAG: cytidylate kinase-like family protein [Deltaproteobacteria bacterium]|nr:MAG: cytidylate kinase-like family protein [Deltaproteobacteria bacterium]